MRRRDCILLIGGAAAAWPLSVRAQQGERMRRIGIMMGGADDAESQRRIAAFRQGLKDLKWIEGANAQLDIRWAVSDPALIQKGVAELLALSPDVILGFSTPVLRALKQATQTVPVVFTVLSDPVGDGIVASLAKPGGNITGFASFEPAIGGKWLQLLKEAAPDIRRVAVLYNPDTAPHALFMPVIEAEAPAMGVTLVRMQARDAAAIESAIEAFAREPGGAMLTLPDVFIARNRKAIFAAAALRRIPTMYAFRNYVADGGLISYGSDGADQFRRAASHVDLILRGAGPADLAVQQPTRYEMAINLKTARELGLTVSPLLLAQADEVIE
jgi:putative tryptophan/tyrosine transport system substrate-binding protein